MTVNVKCLQLTKKTCGPVDGFKIRIWGVVQLEECLPANIKPGDQLIKQVVSQDPTPALRRLNRVDFCRLKASLLYIASLRLDRAV